jgi:hypothetical protein
MATLHVEKLGGFAGFGGSNARIRSRGQIDSKTLSPADQKTVDGLFKNEGKKDAPKGADSFRYRITRTTAAGTETVEAEEADVPMALASCVKDEFV